MMSIVPCCIKKAAGRLVPRISPREEYANLKWHGLRALGHEPALMLVNIASGLHAVCVVEDEGETMILDQRDRYLMDARQAVSQMEPRFLLRPERWYRVRVVELETGRA